MDLKIIEEKKVSLLDRTEFKLEINFEKVVPSREEIVKTVAAKTASKENLVVVRKISTIYGKTKAEVIAYVYTDEKSLKTIETRAMLKRHTKPAKEN